MVMPYIEFFIGIVFLALFFYSLLKYKNRIAALFSLTCLSIAVYTIGYGYELLAQTQEQVQFALNIEIFGVVFIPTFWILVSLEFNSNKSISFFTRVMIMTIPTLTLFIGLTNRFHHLYYTKFTIHEYNNYITAYIDKGPWYFVFISYAYLGILFSLFVFFKKWKEAAYSIKTQAFWMFIGSFCPGLSYFIYVTDIFPSFYDLTTFGYAFLAICFFIAIVKYNFLDLDQIARDHVFDEIKEGIIVIDHLKRIIDFNRAGTNTFSWLNNNCIGKNIMSFPEGYLISRTTSDHFNVKIIRDNQMKYIGFMMTPIIKKNKPIGKILIFQDITDQTLVLEELNHLATHDPLSGIYNRRKLMEEAEKEFYRKDRHGSPLSALMIDIDYFKRINDTYGHLAGDKVITSIVKICQNQLRKSDIIGRYGGEEFLVLLTGMNLKKALRIAEDMRELIDTTVIEFDNQKIKAQISIGVASTSSYTEKTTLNELINDSDKALYNAKNAGRNQVCTVANP
jgi:diguanylate cyclase (GGDEF)-like protein